jgi:hypothetical protein
VYAQRAPNTDATPSRDVQTQGYLVKRPQVHGQFPATADFIVFLSDTEQNEVVARYLPDQIATAPSPVSATASAPTNPPAVAADGTAASKSQPESQPAAGPAVGPATDAPKRAKKQASGGGLACCASPKR